jgi:hypothetical protein
LRFPPWVYLYYVAELHQVHLFVSVSNRFQAVVRHKRGKLTLINHFSDFKDFLATVRELNPGVDIKGF